MFKRKNMLLAVAVSALLAACGGSDDPAPSAAAPNGGGSSAAAGNTAAAASALRGSLVNVGDNVLFSDVRITTTQLADATAFPNGVGPFTRGTNSPLTNFGWRVQPQNMEGTAAQTTKASFAIDMSERAGTAGIGAGEAAEALQVMVDNVSVTANADGTFTLADTAGSKVYVYFKPATGTAVNASAAANGLVELAVDPEDPTAALLTLDLETAISRAIAASTGANATTLAKIKDIAGVFDFKALLSNVGLTRTDGTTPLTGTAMTVTGAGQTTAAGGGVSGRVQFD